MNDVDRQIAYYMEQRTRVDPRRRAQQAQVERALRTDSALHDATARARCLFNLLEMSPTTGSLRLTR